MKNRVQSILLAAGLAACLGSTSIAATPGTSFTYQGVLKNNGTPVGSSVNVTFRLFDAASGGTQVGSSIVRSVTPDEGVFSESLDFGESAFAANQALWIEIEVDGDLLGRQALEATPFALNTRGMRVDPGVSVNFDTEQINVSGHSASLTLDSNGGFAAISLDRSSVDKDSILRWTQNGAEEWRIGLDNQGANGNFWTVKRGGDNAPPMLLVDTTGRVGIGTAAPEQMLSVRGQIDVGDPTASSQAVRLFVNTGSWYMGSNNSGSGTAGNQFYIYDNQSNIYAITAQRGTGRVGIGTTTPTTMLDVDGAVTIRGGADIVEGFDASCGSQIEPGTLMVIDPQNPGKLMPSSMPYDGKVAGIVSGANGVKPGIKLGQDGVMDGDIPVAMTGRVYVKCSTENGEIQPGDLLTTAARSGHAMKATDRARAHGAVIGKAMSTLSDDTGMVLVLVNLQ